MFVRVGESACVCVKEEMRESRSACGGCVGMCLRAWCVCLRARACAEGKTITAIQPFCLMKNGRLAFRDVVMCRILMCAL